MKHLKIFESFVKTPDDVIEFLQNWISESDDSSYVEEIGFRDNAIENEYIVKRSGSLNENTAFATRAAQLYGIKIMRVERSFVRRMRPGVKPTYTYVAIYEKKNILVGYSKSLNSVHKYVMNFVKNALYKIDRIVQRAKEKVEEWYADVKVSYDANDVGFSRHDRNHFRHVFSDFQKSPVDIASIFLKHKSYNCRIKITATNSFRNFHYDLIAVEKYDEYGRPLEIKYPIDINDVKSSMKLLHMYAMGIFDED